MKKLILSLFFLLLFNPYIFSRNFQLDLLFGFASNSGIVIGLGVKNMYKGFGMYYHTNGLGTAYTGSTGINYGSISDHTQVTNYGVTEKNTYGMSLGVTYDLSDFFNKEDIGLTLFLGTGYAVKQEVSERFEYYIWDGLPELNEGNLITWISKESKLPIIELVLGYDFKLNDNLRFNLNSGYATSLGLIGMFGIVYYFKTTSP